MKPYLIVGNGVSGNAAAETIRRIDPEGEIVILSRERHYFYYVPALPDYLCGQKQIKDFTVHNQGWYDKNRIDLHLDTAVTEIQPGGKVAITDKGDRFHYRHLLLTCGGSALIPPIPGSQSSGVFALRTLADADAIRERARQSRKAVVIGGGLLGLEAGNGLRKMGLAVSVVEFFPRLLPRQMDIAGASLLQRQLEGMGFHFFLGTKTQKIESDGRELRVFLEGGERLTAELILISAGVRPEIYLNKFLNLPIGTGVKVDDHMRTGIDGIYAAGDLIEHRGRYYGSWTAAMEQGRVAGANMAGRDTAYEGTISSNTLKVAGIDLVAAGEIDGEGKREAAVIKNEDKKTYRKVVFEGDTIIGAIFFGNIRGNEQIQKAIKLRKNISPWKHELGKEGFDFTQLA